jgi:hypothetical protein
MMIGMVLAVPVYRRRGRRILPLCLGLVLMITSPGCILETPPDVHLRIQGIGEGGGPVHAVPVTVSYHRPPE